MSKMMGERNLYKADAHAKLMEHELVSRRYLEIREENDFVKLENERLKDALRNLGHDIDDIMTQYDTMKKLKIKNKGKKTGIGGST